MQKKIAGRHSGGIFSHARESKMKNPARPTRLLNSDRVAIVGGGSAGLFFAIHLLREAKQSLPTVQEAHGRITKPL
jgi:NADPH-dependent glutamate synthase beta subunit-like oxidoreductase